MNNALKLLLVSLISIGLLTGCGEKKKEEKPSTDNPTVNTNPGVTDNKEQNGLKYTKGSLIRENGLSTYTVYVQNQTGSDYPVVSIDVIFKDKDGNEIKRSTGTIAGESIAAGETKVITIATDMDLSNAYTIEYSENK